MTAELAKCHQPFTDNCHLLIILSVQLCVQRDGRFDVMHLRVCQRPLIMLT